MLALTGEQLAQISAAFARVSANENHKFPTNDEALDQLTKNVGAETWNVYDLGPRDQRTRYLRFDFPRGLQIELAVGPQPELVHTDNRPDDDGPTPGTPIAMAA